MPSEFFDFPSIFWRFGKEASHFKHIISPIHSPIERLAFKSERENEGIWVQKWMCLAVHLTLGRRVLLVERNTPLPDAHFPKEQHFQRNKIFITGISQIIIHLRVLTIVKSTCFYAHFDSHTKITLLYLQIISCEWAFVSVAFNAI